jgi:hypothetical protein
MDAALLKQALRPATEVQKLPQRQQIANCTSGNQLPMYLPTQLIAKSARCAAEARIAATPPEWLCHEGRGPTTSQRNQLTQPVVQLLHTREAEARIAPSDKSATISCFNNNISWQLCQPTATTQLVTQPICRKAEARIAPSRQSAQVALSTVTQTPCCTNQR